MRDTDTVNLTQTSEIHDKDGQPPMQEYEELYNTVQHELKRCQAEQQDLRNNLEAVISENQSLSEQLKIEISKNNSSFQSALNDNVKQQLDAALKEKDSAVEMWQTSLNLVSALENELKDYRDNSHLTSAVEKLNEVRAEYSRAISLLEEKLSASSSRLLREKTALKNMEENHTRLENDHKLLLERYNKQCADLDRAMIDKESALQKIADLEKTNLQAQANSKEANLACGELEAALERSLARLEEVLSREAEAREKVDEALQIVDVALVERDNSQRQANQLSEEVQKLQATVTELIAKAGSEVQAEAEKIKDQYNSRIRTLLLDMRRIQAENKSKTTQIQKLKSDLTALDSELQRTKRDLDTAVRDRPSLYALDRKLESLFRIQDHGGESVRADYELEQLRSEIAKLNQSKEEEQQQYIIEIQVLEEQVNILQTKLEECSRIISEYASKNEELNVALQKKDQDFSLLSKAYSSNNPHNSLNKKCSCDDPSIPAPNPFQESDLKIGHEFQRQLDRQRELTNKWKSEVKLITSRFQSRLQELHSEALMLRRERRELHNQLQAVQYQLKNQQSSHFVYN